MTVAECVEVEETSLVSRFTQKVTAMDSNASVLHRSGSWSQLLAARVL